MNFFERRNLDFKIEKFKKLTNKSEKLYSFDHLIVELDNFVYIFIYFNETVYLFYKFFEDIGNKNKPHVYNTDKNDLFDGKTFYNSYENCSIASEVSFLIEDFDEVIFKTQEYRLKFLLKRDLGSK